MTKPEPSLARYATVPASSPNAPKLIERHVLEAAFALAAGRGNHADPPDRSHRAISLAE